MEKAEKSRLVTHKYSFVISLPRIIRLIILVLVLFFSSNCSLTSKPVEENYQAKLDRVRDHKQQQLVDYMANVEKLAALVDRDKEMKRLFLEKNRLYRQYKNRAIPPEAQNALMKLRNSIENRYIESYLLFYDILFIDNSGDIFYTVRRQADYHKNIFAGELAATDLSKQLINRPRKTFVDFQNYVISGEPSAFFVQPCIIGPNAEMHGWIVFQFSINRINDMFSLEDDLGITGEVFLVNKDNYMLTDSRFSADSTALKQHLSEENIAQKFKERTGNKTVIDYRGHRALTSFKVVSIMNSEWLLIAKIDEDEVLTEEYKKNREENRRQLLRMAGRGSKKCGDVTKRLAKDVEVDMDEFRRVSRGETIHTHGVSACTAVLISCRGRFAYLAHVSPNDSIYGGNQTDLVRIMLKRIENFEIVRNDMRKLEVVIVTPNIGYTQGVIDLFVDRGIFLSQIKLLHNPDSRYANITHDYKEGGDTLVEWRLRGEQGELRTLDLSGARSLGEMMREISA